MATKKVASTAQKKIDITSPLKNWEIVMNEQFDEMKVAAEKMLRQAAARYGKSAEEYGRVLSEFGKGGTDAADVVKTGFNLAVHTARGTVDDGVTLGAAYYRWAYSLIGMRPLDIANAGSAANTAHKTKN